MMIELCSRSVKLEAIRAAMILISGSFIRITTDAKESQSEFVLECASRNQEERERKSERERKREREREREREDAAVNRVPNHWQPQQMRAAITAASTAAVCNPTSRPTTNQTV